MTGSGRGIGAAIALALAEAGADVVLTARTKEQLDEVASRSGTSGRRAVVVPGDVNDEAHLRSLVDAATGELGGLDVVVNNAGGSMPGAFLDTPPRAMVAAFKFNVLTAFTLTQLATPALLESGQGAVVNISSAMGRLTGPGLRRLRHGQGRPVPHDPPPGHGPGAPGAGQRHRRRVGGHDGPRRRPPERRAPPEMVERTPLKRLGEPEDIAITALYLASPAGSFVTGKVLEVDGGIESPNLGLGLPDL